MNQSYVVKDILGIAYRQFDDEGRARDCAASVSIYQGIAYVVEMYDEKAIKKIGGLRIKGRKIAKYENGREIPLFK